VQDQLAAADKLHLRRNTAIQVKDKGERFLRLGVGIPGGEA